MVSQLSTLNPQLLFQHFATLADTPEAGAKLRRFVLDLAVRGRLVAHAPQAAQDPAWVKFCERHVGSAETDATAQALFGTPAHWCWASLKEVAESCGQKKPDGRFTYVDVGAIDNENGTIKPDVGVLTPEDAPSRARKLVVPGSVIYATVRPYLRNIAVIDRKFTPPAIVSTAFAVLYPKTFLQSRYLFYWLRSQPFQKVVEEKMKGVAYPALSDSEFWQCPIPLPSPEEQRRIVAKVEELLALCDQLEARQTTVAEDRTRLVRSALNHLTAAKDQQDFRNCASFILHHSPFLLENVPSLRQAILSLAVQGRLSRSSDPRRHEDSDDELPTGWRWVKLAEVADHRLGKMLDNQKNRGTPRPYLRNTNVHWFRLDLSTIKEMRLEDDELATYELARGDVLICEGGHGIGRTAVWEGERPGMRFQKALHRVRPGKQLNGHFLSFCMKVYSDIGTLADYFTGAGIPHLTGRSLARLRFPLPPLAEQDRVVAKVEELMRWCDQLEAHLTTAQTTATRLLDATLKNLL